MTAEAREPILVCPQCGRTMHTAKQFAEWGIEQRPMWGTEKATAWAPQWSAKVNCKVHGPLTPSRLG